MSGTNWCPEVAADASTPAAHASAALPPGLGVQLLGEVGVPLPVQVARGRSEWKIVQELCHLERATELLSWIISLDPDDKPVSRAGQGHQHLRLRSLLLETFRWLVQTRTHILSVQN